jgi:hypothetical protein
MPDSAMVYNNRAITYQDMGDHYEAIADLTRAIELQPKLGKAYYNRGLAYLALDDYDRAIADLRKAIELQPDLSAANYALALAYAAIAQTPPAQAIPGPLSTGTAWSTATHWPFPSEAETIVPLEQPPTPIAVYVPQPHETPTTPLWEITQELCDRQQFEMWVSPGRYLYRVTPDGGASYLISVVQELRETTPSVGQCRLPWLNYGGASSTGSPETAADANKDYADFCAYDSSTPPGAVTTTGREAETKRIDLGTFLTVREDTSYKYHLPYPKYVNDPQGTIATSEWYACGYGLIRAWTLHTGKYQGRDFDKEYGIELVSFTPLSTNESHVRHILVDPQLSGNVAAYRGEITDEETAEALRRWDTGVRVANIEQFERTIINGQWQIVYAGTRNPIISTDVILTIDSSR